MQLTAEILSLKEKISSMCLYLNQSTTAQNDDEMFQINEYFLLLYSFQKCLNKTIIVLYF